MLHRGGLRRRWKIFALVQVAPRCGNSLVDRYKVFADDVPPVLGVVQASVAGSLRKDVGANLENLFIIHRNSPAHGCLATPSVGESRAAVTVVPPTVAAGAAIGAGGA